MDGYDAVLIYDGECPYCSVAALVDQEHRKGRLPELRIEKRLGVVVVPRDRAHPVKGFASPRRNRAVRTPAVVEQHRVVAVHPTTEEPDEQHRPAPSAPGTGPVRSRPP